MHLRPQWAIRHAATGALRGILDHGHPRALCEGLHPRHIGRVAEEVHHDYRRHPALEQARDAVEVGTEGGGVEIVQAHPHSGEERGCGEVNAGVPGIGHHGAGARQPTKR